MKMCRGKLGSVALLCMLALAGPARAQDVIGVLPEVLQPEVAEKLQLTDEQRTQFSELIKRRTGEMVGLAQQLREVPPDQKERLRNDFRVESERLGFAILNVEQRSLMEQIRVNKLGLLSLKEPTIAKVLNLADWQQAKVSELVARAHASSRAADAERVRADVERAIRAEISDSQWSAWQVLAGRSPGAKIGTPQPPERPSTASVANAATADSSANADSGRTRPASPDRTPISDVKLQMNFQAMPWPDVLRWLCEQADMSLQADTMPPGSFTYRDNSRQYSVGEAMDIMSASLLNKGFALLRRDRLLMVVDLEAPMVPNMIKELAEFVTLDQLDSRGDFELVKCLFHLSRMDPDEAKEEIEQLLSLQGSVISLRSAGQVQVTDTAGVLRAVRALIEHAEDPKSLRGSSIVAIPLKHITANEVLDVARPLLNLPEGTNSNQDISLSTDTFGNTLFINAKKTEDTQKLRDLIEHLDVAPSGADQVGGTREQPVVQIHELKGSDPDLSYRVISQRLASEPDVRMELDKATNKLVVQARPTTHLEIEELLRLLSGQSSQFEVIELKNLDTQLAIATIKKFFGLSDTGTAESGAPIIDGDLIMRRLYVKASPTQLEQIRTLIDKLEGNAASSSFGENVRVIPLSPRKFENTMEQISRLWNTTKNRNRLRVVRPGEMSSESSLPQKAINVEPVRTSNRERPSMNGSTVNGGSEFNSRGRNAAHSQTTERDDAGSHATPQDEVRSNDSVQPPTNVEQVDSEQPKQDEQPADSDRPRTSAALRSGHFVATAAVADEDFDVQASEDQQASPASSQPQEDRSPTDQPAQPGANSPATNEDNTAPADDIVIMSGPGGLIVTSNDKEALAEFDQLLRLLVEQSSLGSSEPTFYWLKYIRAGAAKELLEAVLSGSSTAGSSSGGGGGLIGDMVSEVGGGLLGSLLGGGSGGGGIGVGGGSLTSGDVIINADPRLNALIIRANALDLELCEQVLKVIDQPDSPISVQTRGRIEVIPVISQDAEAVATMIKSLFSDRIEGGGSSGGGSSQRQPDPRELIAALTGGGSSRRGGSANSQLTETKISVSVDKNTNSLVVMAQPQDIDLIHQLVAELDVAGGDVEEKIEVVSLTGTNLNVDMIDTALKGVLGTKARTNTTSNSSSGSSSSSQSQERSSSDSDQARRTAEFYQQLRERFQGGSSGRGSSSGSSSGGFGGFGGFRGPPSGGSSSGNQSNRGGR